MASHHSRSPLARALPVAASALRLSPGVRATVASGRRTKTWVNRTFNADEIAVFSPVLASG
jgi:hypothetical protein